MTSALLTDLYQLTMVQGYFLRRRDPLVAFELFFRRAPFGGSYALLAGAEEAVDMVSALRFTPDELAYLRSLELFREEFLAFLAGWRFRGALHAVPEGTAVFPGEPLLRVTARLTEAQLVESMLLNMINFQTLIATKAARIVQAAGGGPVLEFGLRRAQGRDGALSAARAAYIGGVQGTSNVAAGQRYGIPVGGTMAHSWIQSFASEQEAFDCFAEFYPDRAILLVDTYDTLASGIPHAIPALTRLQAQGRGGFGVRLDSGDLGPLSRAVRARLDAAGLQRAQIVASNDLDEARISALRAAGAPIDVWGVGTRLVTAYDDPALGGVYKLVAVRDGGAWQPSAKRSEESGKATLPGIKQVVRCVAAGGRYRRPAVPRRRGGHGRFRRANRRAARPAVGGMHARREAAGACRTVARHQGARRGKSRQLAVRRASAGRPYPLPGTSHRRIARAAGARHRTRHVTRAVSFSDLLMSDIGSWIPETTLDLRNLLGTETYIARIILHQIQQQGGCFVLTLVREGTNCCDRLRKQPDHQRQCIKEGGNLASAWAPATRACRRSTSAPLTWITCNYVPY